MRVLKPVRPSLKAFYKKVLTLHFNAKVVRVINDTVSEDPKKHTHECAQIRCLKVSSPHKGYLQPLYFANNSLTLGNLHQLAIR